MLVSPRRQVEKVKELTTDEMFEIFKVGQVIGKVLSKHFKTDDFQYAIQDGYDAG